MSSLSTLPKGDSAWLLRKSIQRIMQQVSVLETNIGSSTTGNSANTQVIFNDAGTLRGDAGLTYNKATDTLSTGSATITGDLTVDTSTLKVDSANNRVGIGTASPTVALDVVGASAISGTVSVGTTTPLATASGRGNVTVNGSTDAILAFGIAGVNSGFVLQDSAGMTLLSSGATYLRCYTNGSERYKIDSTGVATWENVGGVAGTAMTLNSTGLGIGAAPELKLRVDGPDAAPATSGSSTTNGAFRIGAAGASTNLCVDAGVSTTGGVYGWFQARSRGNYALNYDLVFNPNGGNVGIGVTPSAGGGCLQLKSGITFPATQVASSDANTLDDYEEGTWTPVVADASTGGNTGTCTINSAKYVKIGRQVSVQCDISGITTTGMTAGNVFYIRGLPFTSVQGGNGNFYTYRVGRNASTVSSSAVAPDATSHIVFSLFTTNSATTDIALLVSDIVSTTSQIILSVTYFV